MAAKIAPFGSWKSPITSDLIVAATRQLGDVWVDGETVYWTEMRPEEGGRYVVVRRDENGRTESLTPAGFNARTRVHEYGGAAFAVADGVVYFANYDDQRLYRQAPGETPQPLTPRGEDRRYADFAVDAARGRLVCVREDHTGAGEAVNSICHVAMAGDAAGGQLMAAGHDFYSDPRLSPDGSHLCFLAWNHPNMPWDGCELWVAPLDAGGAIGKPRLVAGGRDESIFQPAWSPDGTLYFVSDRSGWWNLYRERDGTVEPVCPREAEFGQPLWRLGASTYGFASADRIICTYGEAGGAKVAGLDPESGRLEPYDLPFTSISSLHVGPGFAVFAAGSPTRSAELARLDLATGRTETLARTSDVEIAEGYLSVPRAIEFPTEGGVTAHAFFYPPRNADFAAPTGERPPLLVKCHGGPTSATSSVLNPQVQYWTSRGIGVLDVNYGGSTGFGRDYRRRLNGNWGVVDVDDCVNGARYLAERGEVDGDRLLMTGGSAGGYTTLCVLTFRDVFRAGASHFGIGDLEVFAGDTHKFESRYLDGLVGPFPERRDLYRARSAINFTDRLKVPVIFFQGLEDKVVPPNQAELMVAALRGKGLPVAYVAFPGEQHGFRRAENIKRALDGELYFYARVLGFELAEPVEPVEIENLG